MATKVQVGIPEQALDWVREVFSAVNRQVAGALSRVPTHHEPELDMQFIAALNQAPPVADVAGWGVYIQTHFLGGRRHFYNWEVADIGLLAIFRDRGKVRRIKVGLFQSKRLYPKEVAQIPDYEERFRIGFGTLLQSPEAFHALAAGRTFSFNESCAYLAIANGSDQQRALAAYEKMSGIPVYYLLYNPVVIPWAAIIPAKSLDPLPANNLGCRVVTSRMLDGAIAARSVGYHPSLVDVGSLPSPFRGMHQGGWSLEHFVADEFLRCREGHVASDETDHVLEQLFYRRSGPIAAAIAVTVEAPDGVDLVLPELSNGTRE